MKESLISKFNTGQWVRKVPASSYGSIFFYDPSFKAVRFLNRTRGFIEEKSPIYCKIEEDSYFFSLCSKSKGAIEFMIPSLIKYKN